MSDNAICTVLMNSALGRDLDATECEALTRLMGVVTLRDGELLAQEGDGTRTLFVLVTGRLDVITHLTGVETTLYHLRPGDCAGTRAFVDGTPRPATLTAIGDVTAYTLEPAALETLLDVQPRVVYKVMRGLFRTTHSNLDRMNAVAQQLTNYISKTGGRY